MGNIPKNRDREELLEEFSKHARKSSRDDKTERMRTYTRVTIFKAAFSNFTLVISFRGSMSMYINYFTIRVKVTYIMILEAEWKHF